MSTSRRTFLQLSAAAGGALGLGALPKFAFGAPRGHDEESRVNQRAAAPLNILIIGGTGFTGPEQVEHALARGHKVTVINRNRRRPDLFKGKKPVEQLVGDLNADMSALKGRKFDVVIDIPTTFPAWVRNVAQYMAGNTKHYIFISTLSVYSDNSKIGADETTATTPMPEGVDPYTLVPQHQGQHYGALKTAAEKEVEKHYPGMNTIIRPGLIVGPLDPSDRFTYWPVRIDKGGEVLAPGSSNDPTQIIDSRDLAEWTIRMAENHTMGVYNGVGPVMSMAEMLYGIKAVTTAGAQFTWVPAAFLREQKIRPWRDMPTWIPPEGQSIGFSRFSNAKAVANGLTFRPLAVTAKDTLDWHKTRPEAERKAMDDGARAGIPAAREAEVLAAWKAKPK
jgi:2'-hydroxyisoflavone reductase